jgi:hypothetical protein
MTLVERPLGIRTNGVEALAGSPPKGSTPLSSSYPVSPLVGQICDG